MHLKGNLKVPQGEEQTKKENTQGVKTAGLGGMDGPQASCGWGVFQRRTRECRQ